MALFKRKNSPNWWLDIRAPDGKRLRRSTGTKSREEAQEYHDRLKAELWRVKKLGDRPRHSWKEAALRWVKDKKHKVDLASDIGKIRWLDPYFGDLMLDEIDADLIEEVAEIKADEGVEDPTVNRYLSLIRAILRRAHRKWKWLDQVPLVELRPETERVRWLTREEAGKLCEALPPYYALPARFALATGLRQSNVLQLCWDQVDLERQCAWIHARQSKTKSAIAVALNADAIAVLEACRGQHPERVFVKQGRPFRGICSRAWKRALEEAGITDFRWHDLRHTWASWHVMAGTRLHELMELGGWKTYRMVLRYAHLSADHLKNAASRIEAPTAPTAPAPSPPPRSGRPQLQLVK
ncbi:MAG TPA: site-specific integrase [Gammaproteobacteria bacterium]|nr:site-specific integrase [Gammaproteobacteria bacterium]